MKNELQSKNQQILFQEAVKEKPKAINNGIKSSDLPKYSYADLVKPADELPEGVLTEFREVIKK